MEADGAVEPTGKKRKNSNKLYMAELARLQEKLVKLQGWIKENGPRVVALFGGRDAAGKGDVITRYLNPRFCRVVGLGTPTEREKTQWCFQRYVARLRTAGEMVLFDHSWYNRASVRHARLNYIRHLLCIIPYEAVTPDPTKLPSRERVRMPMPEQTFVPDIYH